MVIFICRVSLISTIAETSARNVDFFVKKIWKEKKITLLKKLLNKLLNKIKKFIKKKLINYCQINEIKCWSGKDVIDLYNNSIDPSIEKKANYGSIGLL